MSTIALLFQTTPPYLLRLAFLAVSPASRQCRLNSSLLAQASFKEFLHSQISLFFDTNDSPEISRRTLWDTFKAFMRGQSISYVSTLKKAEREESEALTREIFRIDSLYALAPTPALYKERLHLQSKFDLYSTSIKHRSSYFLLNNISLSLAIKRGSY